VNVKRDFEIIGIASSLGCPHAGCSDGPNYLKENEIFRNFINSNPQVTWGNIFFPDEGELVEVLTKLSLDVAKEVDQVIQQKKIFLAIGGDHSCAIGSWSGAYAATMAKGPLGLIWIDAHADSHTPETSHSSAYHGMPLAVLLGHGNEGLTGIINSEPKLRPENISIIGVRSYEPEEEELLEKLNVRVFFMDEVHQRGFDSVFAEALQIASNNTADYGITVDIDALDPRDAPGVTVPEPDGISCEELCRALGTVRRDDRLLGLEIAEFNPHLDKDDRTTQVIVDIIDSIIG